MHVAAVSMPVTVEYFPASHAMHTSLDCAGFVKYFPASHSIHLEAASLSGDTAVMYLPAAQAIQSDFFELSGEATVV
jgi:hypothetical protein